MVPWWKRLLCSLLSVVVATGFFVLCWGLWALHGDAKDRIEPGGFKTFLYSFASLMLIWLIFSLPGWLLAIPFVLIVKDFSGWRFWMYWAIGSALGPLFILGLSLYGYLSGPHFSGFSPGWSGMVLSAAVACLTTLIYLLLVRRAQAKAPVEAISV